MPRPPKLTDTQRRQLSNLEPELRAAVSRGDYQGAKRIVSVIQELLRPTGHETRLMKAKVWMYEAAMEAGSLNIAISGLLGVQGKTGPRTRVHLEATALLAICYLRQLDMAAAEPMIAEVLNNESVIKSPSQRRKFRRRIIERFEEETLLASARRLPQDRLDADMLFNDAGPLVINRSEDEIYAILGRSLPSDVEVWLRRVDEISRRQLPVVDQRLLPPPQKMTEPRRLGKRLIDAVARVIWKSLCHPESDIYKAWTNGTNVLLDKKWVAGSVAATLSGTGLGIKAVGVSVVALVMRMSIEVYCEAFKPAGLLDEDDPRG